VTSFQVGEEGMNSDLEWRLYSVNCVEPVGPGGYTHKKGHLSVAFVIGITLFIISLV